MTRRIVIFGPECTGKSTLALALAGHFGGVVSGEFVRKWVDRAGRLPAREDLPEIVAGQLEVEMDAVHRAGRGGMVFHDTDLHTHGIYADYYLGGRTAEAEHHARSAAYTHHLLCDIDLPWEPDGLQRDSAEARSTLYPHFLRELDRFRRPYTRISGQGPTREHSAIQAITALLHPR